MVNFPLEVSQRDEPRWTLSETVQTRLIVGDLSMFRLTRRWSHGYLAQCMYDARIIFFRQYFRVLAASSHQLLAAFLFIAYSGYGMITVFHLKAPKRKGDARGLWGPLPDIASVPKSSL